MKYGLSLLTLGVALSLMCASPPPVWAEEGLPIHDEGFDAERRGAEALPFAGAVLDDATLDTMRGGADMDLQLGEILATGTVSEVSASDLATGYNIITEGAYGNTVGIPMTIQNSGNGVLIQNAVVVNVKMQ